MRGLFDGYHHPYQSPLMHFALRLRKTYCLINVTLCTMAYSNE